MREWWERLGRNNQIIVATSSLGVLVALIGFIAWAATPEYRPLFSGLSAQDANAISEKLKEYNVPSKLTDGGKTIEVPAQSYDEMLMKMAGQGLPTQSGASVGAPGDDILKGGSMTDTSEMEQLRMRRSLEERMAHVIMTLDSVSSASVTYAPADSSPLVMNNHDPSASILITPRPGRQLTDENVRSIVRLIQMSASGLSDKNITVADSTGALLWDGTHVGNITANELLTQEQNIAAKWRSELQMVLDRIVGPKNSVVLAHVELNSGETTKDQTTIDPGAPAQKTSTEETLQGQGTLNRTALGAAGNINPATPPAAGGPGTPTYGAQTGDPNSSYKHTEGTTVWQNGTTTTHVKTGMGQIEKVTISALLDSGKIQPANLTNVQTSVQKAMETYIAANPSDAANARLVSVAAVPFNHAEEDAAAKIAAAADAAENTRRMAAILAPFAIMLAALFLLARALRRPSKQALGGQLALASGGGGLAGGLGGGGSLMIGADGLPMVGQTVGSAELDGPIGLTHGSVPKTYEVIEEAFDANLESILHLARSKPEMLTALISSWITEEN
jgi:flagellar M-ring protein FliF